MTPVGLKVGTRDPTGVLLRRAAPSESSPTPHSTLVFRCSERYTKKPKKILLFGVLFRFSCGADQEKGVSRNLRNSFFIARYILLQSIQN